MRICLAFVLLVGCAGPPPDEPPDEAPLSVPTRAFTPDISTLGAVCSAMAVALCRAPSATCEPLTTKPFRDATECVEATRTACVHDLQLPGARPDLSQLQACASALRAPDCGRRLAALRAPFCRPPAGSVKGLLPLGSPCHANGQCATGACAFAGVAAGACGVCVGPALEGDACTNDDGCTRVNRGVNDEGLHCDFAAGLCAPRREVGSACTRDGQCVDGLQCLGRKCAVGAAKPMFSCGDGLSGCDPWSRCASEAGESLKCWPIRLGEEGAPCTEKSATDLRWCRGGLTCRFGTCQRSRLIGEPCTPSTYECGPRATCDPQSSPPVCVSLNQICSE